MSDQIRIAFFGTPDPAVPSLQAFVRADDIEVVAVITNPDRPSGRGHRLRPPPVKEVALDAGLTVLQPERPREILDQLRDMDLDACAVVAYGSILPADVLDVGGRGFVNLHFSLLPAWRGAAPVPASILAGDAETGVTCFRLDPGMDTGDVLVSHATRIAPDETSGELTQRLAVAGAGVLVDAIRGLVHHSMNPVPQDHEAATYAGKISAEDARIDWSADAAHIDRVVRAYNPVPGAHTTLDGIRLKVHRVTPVDVAAADAATGAGGAGGAGSGGAARGGAGRGGAADAAPGVVVAHLQGRPVVACGTGAVRLDQVQPAGKPRMDGASFTNGYAPTVLGT